MKKIYYLVHINVGNIDAADIEPYMKEQRRYYIDNDEMQFMLVPYRGNDNFKPDVVRLN